MGNENSTMVDDSTSTLVLDSRTLEGVAKYLKSGKVHNIVVMTGAGISTSCGIPDFRSPKTGLYSNLARLNLPHPEAVFEISFFRQNPLPFYTLAQELYPGKFRPSITHSFIRLLNDKGLLLKHFTQNIDCLDIEAGVPPNKTIEAHGSFKTSSCIDCHAPYPDDLMKKHVSEKQVPRCRAPGCGGLVKPNIVFFGEGLPSEFFQSRAIIDGAELCIVLGTSLTVQPFASLPELVLDSAPRVLINKERVGSLGSRPDDVLIYEDCDNGVRKLAQACGWLEELEKLWRTTAPGRPLPDSDTQQALAVRSKDEEVEDEVEKLTKAVEQSLKVSEEHKICTNAALGTSGGTGAKSKLMDTTDSGSGSVNMDLWHVYPHLRRKPSL